MTMFSVHRSVCLRERSDAHIFVLDTSTGTGGGSVPATILICAQSLRSSISLILKPVIHPFTQYKVPGGGTMFSEYQLSASIGEADAFCLDR